MVVQGLNDNSKVKRFPRFEFFMLKVFKGLSLNGNCFLKFDF